MKKWLMLALFPLLLAQQEVGATPINTLEIFPNTVNDTRPPPNGGTILPFTSFTLQMNNSRDVIDLTAVFDSSVSLVAAANAQPPTSVLNNSLIQLLISNNLNSSGWKDYLDILTVGVSSSIPGCPSSLCVSSPTLGPFLRDLIVNTTLNEIKAKFVLKAENSATFNAVSAWFDTDYWTTPPPGNNAPYACMRERASFNSAVCSNASTLRFPFQPVSSVPVANSSMLLMVGLAALMVPLRRRTRQF